LGELCGRFASLARLELDQLTNEPEPSAGPTSPPAALPRERVIQIQEMLAELGFDPGTVDGDFGPRTRTAVIEFQRSIDVPPTGRITERDEIALAEAFADLRAQRRVAAADQSRGGNSSGSNGGTEFPAPGSTFRDCSDCPEMMVIPASGFVMGSPNSEEGRYDNEGPQRRVTISEPFALGKYEVTFAEWDVCVAAAGCGHTPNDAGWGRGDRPVINVNWEDAQQYCRWLNKMTGRPYRLPSEAEWEYAARAGSKTAYSWGSEIGDNLANCRGCGSEWGGTQTAPVGRFAGNAFGLFDMHGNVWEWVEDSWHGNYENAPADGRVWSSEDGTLRVVRGGSWSFYARNARAANRYAYDPGDRYRYLGFRCAGVQE